MRDDEAGISGIRSAALAPVDRLTATESVSGEPTSRRFAARSDCLRCRGESRVRALTARSKAPVAPIPAASVGVNAPAWMPPMTGMNRRMVVRTSRGQLPARRGARACRAEVGIAARDNRYCRHECDDGAGNGGEKLPDVGFGQYAVRNENDAWRDQYPDGAASVASSG